jgi:hypothetical protein
MINPYLSKVTFNIVIVKSLIKQYRLAEWITKAKSNKNLSSPVDTPRLKLKEQEKDMLCKWNAEV